MAKKLNGRANCILEVCCAPNSAKQRAALRDELMDAGVMHRTDAIRNLSADDHKLIAGAFADWLADTFDLAPKGSLVAFKAEIARLAREPRAADADQ